MLVWTIAVLLAVTVIVVLVSGVLHWRWLRVEPAWSQWRRTARDMSLRDRRALIRANGTGRAVQDPRLAALAVQRGDLAVILFDAFAVRQTWVFRGIAVLLLAAAVVAMIAGLWLPAWLLLGGAAYWAVAPALVKRDSRRAQRVADVNRAWLEQ